MGTYNRGRVRTCVCVCACVRVRTRSRLRLRLLWTRGKNPPNPHAGTSAALAALREAPMALEPTGARLPLHFVRGSAWPRLSS